MRQPTWPLLRRYPRNVREPAHVQRSPLTLWTCTCSPGADVLGRPPDGDAVLDRPGRRPRGRAGRSCGREAPRTMTSTLDLRPTVHHPADDAGPGTEVADGDADDVLRPVHEKALGHRLHLRRVQGARHSPGSLDHTIVCTAPCQAVRRLACSLPLTRANVCDYGGAVTQYGDLRSRAGLDRLSAAPVVAVLGTRYADFSVEEEVLGPLGRELVSGPGGTRRGDRRGRGGRRRRRARRLTPAVRPGGARPAALPGGRALRHRHRLHRPGRRARTAASRSPGSPTTAPRRSPFHAVALAAALLRTASSPADRLVRARGLGRRRPAPAAPAEHPDRRRGRLRPHRPPGGRLPARARDAACWPTTSTSTCRRRRRRRRRARRAAAQPATCHPARPRAPRRHAAARRAPARR